MFFDDESVARVAEDQREIWADCNVLWRWFGYGHDNKQDLIWACWLASVSLVEYSVAHVKEIAQEK